MTHEKKSIFAIIFLMRRKETPRRHLKRALRDCGMEATGAALDQILDEMDSVTEVERAEIVAEADRMEAMEEAERPEAEPAELAHDEWLICENIAGDRQFIQYEGTDAKFRGEIFDSISEAPRGYEGAPLADGQYLSNIQWEDEEPPAQERQRHYTQARNALRAYDARLGIDGG